MVITMGYRINQNLTREVSIIKKALTIEPNIDGEDRFRKNVYQGMSLLMQGQSQLIINQEVSDVSLLRVHHFVEPHADKFYKNCPECQKEKKEILEENNATKNQSTKRNNGFGF
jgi:hypothetical protein